MQYKQKMITLKNFKDLEKTCVTRNYGKSLHKTVIIELLKGKMQ